LAPRASNPQTIRERLLTRILNYLIVLHFQCTDPLPMRHSLMGKTHVLFPSV